MKTNRSGVDDLGRLAVDVDQGHALQVIMPSHFSTRVLRPDLDVVDASICSIRYVDIEW